MAFDLKLSMKLGQQMVMTPQLQAAIKLLQMNRLELSETIQSELTENPLLEEFSEVSDLEQKKADVETHDNSDQVKEVSPDTNKNPDFDWDNYLEQSFSYSGKSKPGLGGYDGSEDGPGFESVATKKISLAEHLLDQVATSDLDDEEREIAHHVIGSLDEWGYLREPIEEIAKKNKIKVEMVELTLKLIQEFDPVGVGARDLKECLLLQLKSMKIRHKANRELLRQMIETQLPNLEKKNFKAMAKEMGLEMDELGDVIKMLQKFEPRPGRPFVDIDNNYITPDIHIYKVNGEYVISLNEDGLPKLKISNLYRNILKTMPDAAKIITMAAKSQNVEQELAVLSSAVGAEVDPSLVAVSSEAAPKNAKESPKEYIQNKLRAALWLIRSIHQRQRTIYKVTESIVKSQREFLEYGVTHLRPMVLKDIASDIGMHESTISRVTSNKYVHTPQGTFELKYFFSSAIQKSNGGDIAAESVKEKIRMIVKGENDKNPISDQGIVEELRRQGIEIARRTVAKYREMLGILPSSQRKALF
ncbi:MAG: RNA polymerase sigma-54 factor [Deltaproteobacteria bacterium]|nr:RNA polymerase sigma-54 factor [Deltaproteobacteria bacterium]